MSSVLSDKTIWIDILCMYYVRIHVRLFLVLPEGTFRMFYFRKFISLTFPLLYVCSFILNVCNATVCNTTVTMHSNVSLLLIISSYFILWIFLSFSTVCCIPKLSSYMYWTYVISNVLSYFSGIFLVLVGYDPPHRINSKLDTWFYYAKFEFKKFARDSFQSKQSSVFHYSLRKNTRLKKQILISAITYLSKMRFCIKIRKHSEQNK